MSKKRNYKRVAIITCGVAEQGLGLLRDVLVVVVVVVAVMLVDIFVLLSRRPSTKIFIKTKL